MKATGERWERCLWQMKRPERVAAVDRGGRLFKADEYVGHRNRDCQKSRGMRYNRANRLKGA